MFEGMNRKGKFTWVLLQHSDRSVPHPSHLSFPGVINNIPLQLLTVRDCGISSSLTQIPRTFRRGGEGGGVDFKS